jgi:hypothetical protein
VSRSAQGGELAGLPPAHDPCVFRDRCGTRHCHQRDSFLCPGRLGVKRLFACDPNCCSPAAPVNHELVFEVKAIFEQVFASMHSA